MQQIAQEILVYLQGNLVLFLGIALATGFAASKTVTYEGRRGFVFFLIVGLIGLFLGQFMISEFGFKEYIEKLSQFRLLFDLIAAYIGSFIVAAIIHFIKPI